MRLGGSGSFSALHVTGVHRMLRGLPDMARPCHVCECKHGIRSHLCFGCCFRRNLRQAGAKAEAALAAPSSVPAAAVPPPKKKWKFLQASCYGDQVMVTPPAFAYTEGMRHRVVAEILAQGSILPGRG